MCCIVISANDPCESGPCVNGSTCSSSGTKYSCDCPPGWTGTECVVLLFQPMTHVSLDPV